MVAGVARLKTSPIQINNIKNLLMLALTRTVAYQDQLTHNFIYLFIKKVTLIDEMLIFGPGSDDNDRLTGYCMFDAS